MVEEIITTQLLTTGDISSYLKQYFHPKQHALERFAVAFLSHLGLGDISHLMVPGTVLSLTLSDPEKAALSGHLDALANSPLSDEQWREAIRLSAMTAVRDNVEHRAALVDTSECLCFLNLLDAHLGSGRSTSEALLREGIARMVRHLLAFYIFGPFKLTSYLRQRSTEPDFAGVLFFAARSATYVARALLDAALFATTAPDFYLAVLHCSPFSTCAIDLCSFAVDQARSSLDEQQVRFCEQARKPLREIRDHTAGWVALCQELSGPKMTMLVEEFEREVRAVAAAEGIEAAKRAALFRCRTRYEVPSFVLDRAIAALG